MTEYAYILGNWILTKPKILEVNIEGQAAQTVQHGNLVVSQVQGLQVAEHLQRGHCPDSIVAHLDDPKLYVVMQSSQVLG